MVECLRSVSLQALNSFFGGYFVLDVKKIGKNGYDLKNEFDISVPKVFGVGRAVVDFAGRIVRVDKPHYLLEGTASAVLEASCALCLKGCETNLEFEVVENFLKEGEVGLGEDEILFDDECINILPAIQRNLLANIPMRFVCNSNCKGLCAMCGENLNISKCSCVPEGRSEFAALIGKFD